MTQTPTAVIAKISLDDVPIYPLINLRPLGCVHGYRAYTGSVCKCYVINGAALVIMLYVVTT